MLPPVSVENGVTRPPLTLTSWIVAVMAIGPRRKQRVFPSGEREGCQSSTAPLVIWVSREEAATGLIL